MDELLEKARKNETQDQNKTSNTRKPIQSSNKAISRKVRNTNKQIQHSTTNKIKNMGPAIAALLMQTAGQAIGQGMGLLSGEINNRRNLTQQRKLQNLQIQGQKDLTSYNQAAALQMWKDTNYSAQMEELKKAGLNPALLYGMSGGGGATAQVTQGNVSGGHVPQGMGIEMGVNGAQLALLKAQKENIEADTANKLKLPAKTEEETKNLAQLTENAKAQKELTEVQTGIEYVKQHIATMTQNAAVDAVMTELQKSKATLTMLETQRDINTATKEQAIRIIQTELALMIIEKYKKWAETVNIDQNTRESIQKVNDYILRRDIEWYKLGQTNRELDMEWERLDLSGMPKELKDALNNIILIPGMGKGGAVNPIKGFHKR